jgi:hypothetical protein
MGLRELQAAELGLSYDDLISEEVGTDHRRAFLCSDRRAAFRIVRRNRRLARQSQQ